MSRQIIIVDVETNGLDIERHEVFEVAWQNLATGKTGSFIPAHDINELLTTADVKALRVNRYIDRIPGANFDICWIEKLDELWTQLAGPDGEGATLAGSNPAFDAAMLAKLGRRAAAERDGFEHLDEVVWHHRLWDLSAYAAGVLGLDELPGLASVCELLELDTGPDHTAMGDVAATARCFEVLRQRAEYGLS